MSRHHQLDPNNWLTETIDGWTSLYRYESWTDLLMYKNVKRHSYIREIYTHVLYTKYKVCFRFHDGSIDIKIGPGRIFEWWRDGNNIKYDIKVKKKGA
jgi:hypothetical protein